MQITLDGNIYQIKAGVPVRRSPLVNFPENIRLDGQQQRKDRSLLSSWAIDRWSSGLGLEQMNVDVASHQFRLWDAENVDTRWESHVCLSPKFNECSVSPSGEPQFIMQSTDDLYFCQSLDNDHAGMAYKFTPPVTIGSYKHIVGTTNDGAAPQVDNLYGIEYMQNKIHVLTQTRNVPYYSWMHLSSFGGKAYWVGTGNISGISGSLQSRFADCNGTAHLMALGASTVKWYVSDLSLGTLCRVGSITQSHNLGTYSVPLMPGGANVFAILPEGVYNFDAAPNLIVDTKRSADRNPAAVLFLQDLFLKNKKSVIHYDWSVLKNRGYDVNDGLPSDKFGEITSMAATYKYIFNAVKGGTYSHILAMDSNYAWHYYARIPSAGRWVKSMFLSDQPDAIDRLWTVWDDNTIGYFLNPMVNPPQAATYAYVPTGYFRPPRHDGGMPEEPGAYYDMVVTADEVGGEDQNTITVLYGMNGSRPCATLGVVSTITNTAIFGSPYGVEGYRIQPEFMLNQASGASGTTPLFRSGVVHYLKLPNQRQLFDLAIDTRGDKMRDSEAILAELDAIRERRTLIPFSYGAVGTRAVKILDLPADETQNEQYWMELERTGIARIQLAEIR